MAENKVRMADDPYWRSPEWVTQKERNRVAAKRLGRERAERRRHFRWFESRLAMRRFFGLRACLMDDWQKIEALAVMEAVDEQRACLLGTAILTPMSDPAQGPTVSSLPSAQRALGLPVGHMTIKTRTMSGPIEIKAVFTAEEVVHAAQALMNVNLRLRVATQAHVVAAARNVIAD